MTRKVTDFLSTQDEVRVLEAICSAESNTSGEIRIHLEGSIQGGDAFARATQVFDILKMNNTKQSNGVLIYVAVTDKTLVILGDTGINDVVPKDFWERTKDAILSQFKNKQVAQGLVDGILSAGKQLEKHFPREPGDMNELGDSISVG
jgi:uncharacterized membrane protein